MTFQEKLTGALFGVAIGDAMGAPVEGWESSRIAEKFEQWDFAQFLPSMPKRPTGKGDGRVTDDTLMTEALIHAYLKKRDHLDAFDYRDYLLPEMTKTAVWLPEKQTEMPIIDRLNTVEKYTLYRLISFGADPRSAGFGNAVNCAIAMFIMPVGAANAGDPQGAYQETSALGIAASHSYAVEGAAALAAGYAAALAPGATPESVVTAARELARDGTKEAITAVLAATDPADDLPTWIAKVRAAFVPYEPRIAPGVLEDLPLMRVNSSHDAHLSIEEAPVALAALKYGQGDFLRTVRAGVRYGRDCDSIAGMAGGLCGALRGIGGIPESLQSESCRANRRDWNDLARQFAAAIQEIWTRDQHRHEQRKRAMLGPSDAASIPSPTLPTQPTDKPAIRLDRQTGGIHQEFLRKHDLLVRRAQHGNIDVYFIGDSITEQWNDAGQEVWAKTFAPLRAAAFGISGDQPQHVLWRLENGELDNLHPKVVVILIGINCIDRPAAQVAAGVKAVVDVFRTRTPDAKLLLLGIFPKGEKADDPLRARIQAVNARLADFADHSSVFYLDIGQGLLQPDGTLSKAIAPDGGHLSPQGYQIWAQAILPTVRHLMITK